MKIELTGANFLSLQELGELAARLDVLHEKTVKAIDRLQGEIEAQKTRIGNHWRENRMNAIALAIRTWQMARPSPVSTVSLAYSKMGEDGAIVTELTEIGEALAEK
jgi:hypothetical protein